MALYSSTIFLQNELNVSFINNSAEETGGAIHIEPDITRSSCPECFYKVRGYYTRSAFYYSNNLAKFGGDDIYGTSLALCKHLEHYHIHNFFASNISMSSVSSDPRQVCFCNSDGQPQCKNVSHTLTNKRIYPGEMFTIPAVTVGGDYGTTIGTIHTSFKSSNLSTVPVLKSRHMYSQWIDNLSMCSDLDYTIYSRHSFTMYLVIHFSKHFETTTKNNERCNSTQHGYDSTTLASINTTILPCPLGLRLLENSPRCDCHPILIDL